VADDAVAATSPADAGAGAITSSIMDIAALESERITQSSGGADATQQLGVLTRTIAPPPAAMVTDVIKVVIIIP
jgi:hypothetical protein